MLARSWCVLRRRALLLHSIFVVSDMKRTRLARQARVVSALIEKIDSPMEVLYTALGNQLRTTARPTLVSHCRRHHKVNGLLAIFRRVQRRGGLV